LKGKRSEISKDQISKLELKKGGYFQKGYLSIALKSSEETKLGIKGKTESNGMKNLIQAFYPEVLHVVE
jgi:hypothetical protein